ncbi:MAG TPA: TPM domain-containing protein [Thermoanaerobaculia bacterium]|nr:TPM domain-containing protein [Thermoanaerobaculia bacterium]
MKQEEFLAKLDRQALLDAINRAENACSGEVRIHVQPKASGGELRWVAERTFERLGMAKTASRTGVLLFIASEEQRFVILGDKGINDLVPADFWDEIAARLTERFKAGEFSGGIVAAVDAVGEKLRTFFPLGPDDRDELSDELSIGTHTDSP